MPLFQKALNDVKRECGVLIDGISSLLIEKYGLINEQEAPPLEIQDDHKDSILLWAYDNFTKLVKQKPKDKEDLVAYLFKLLTIEYKCINQESTIEIPEDLLNAIRNELIIALKL